MSDDKVDTVVIFELVIKVDTFETVVSVDKVETVVIFEPIMKVDTVELKQLSQVKTVEV